MIEASEVMHEGRPLLDWYLDVGTHTGDVVAFAVAPPPERNLPDNTIEFLRQHGEASVRSIATIADRNLRLAGYEIAYETLSIQRQLIDLSPESQAFGLSDELLLRIEFLRIASRNVLSAVAFEHGLVWHVLVEQGRQPDPETAVQALFPNSYRAQE